MNRRGFLKGLGLVIGGVVLEQAVPLGRVWSFPAKIVPLNVARLDSAFCVDDIRRAAATLTGPLIHPRAYRDYLKLSDMPQVFPMIDAAVDKVAQALVSRSLPLIQQVLHNPVLVDQIHDAGQRVDLRAVNTVISKLYL